MPKCYLVNEQKGSFRDCSNFKGLKLKMYWEAQDPKRILLTFQNNVTPETFLMSSQINNIPLAVWNLTSKLGS